MLTPCCICQEARTGDLSALSCGHIFHHACNRRCPLCRQLVKGSVKLVLDTSDIVKCGNCLPSQAVRNSQNVVMNPVSNIISIDDEEHVISDSESETSSLGSEDEYEREDLEDRLHESETQRAQLISRVDNLMRQLSNLSREHEKDMTDRHVHWIQEQRKIERQLESLKSSLEEVKEDKKRVEQERDRYRNFLREVSADRDALQQEVDSLKHLRVAREVHRAIFEAETGEEELIKSLQILGPEAILDSIRQLSRLSRQSQRGKEEIEARLQQEQVEREGLKRKLSKLQDQCQVAIVERDEYAQEVMSLKNILAELRPQPVSTLSIVEDENLTVNTRQVRPPILQLPSKITAHAKRVAGQHPDGSGGSTKVYFR